MNRRRFLKTLGLGASAGMLGLPRVASANGAPKRLIILSSAHGSIYDHWKMRPSGASDEERWTAKLNKLDESDYSMVFAPLRNIQSRTVMLDGISLASAELDLPGYRHEKGWIHSWTGDWVHFTGDALFATKPSLDQLVAGQIARPDRIPSLELSVEYGRPTAHAGMSQQMPMEENPTRVWQRLFGLSGSTDPLLAAQGSVLDFVNAEHDAVRKKLGRADKQRLERHFGLVRQLEQRIDGLSKASCAVAPGVDQIQVESGRDAYDSRFKAFGELVAAAFSCDLTRVAMISLGDIPAEAFTEDAGDVHERWAHEVYNNAEAAFGMGMYNAFHAGQVAWLTELLESLPDSDGGSVMDNTLIVWGSELADGWHGYEKYQLVLVGGNWAWKGGRYLHYPWQSTPIRVVTPNGANDAGIPHQHVLVSIAQAMGLHTDHVGLAEVRNKQSKTIDLRGPLEGL